MAASDLLDIWNAALLNATAKSAIASLTEQSAEAAACARRYPSIVRTILRDTDWNCVRRRVALDEVPEVKFDAFNLSDIFEYMSLENTEALLRTLASRGERGARLVYWNMLAPRSRPETLAKQLKPLPNIADGLFSQDKAFFYSRLVVEEVQ